MSQDITQAFDLSAFASTKTRRKDEVTLALKLTKNENPRMLEEVENVADNVNGNRSKAVAFLIARGIGSILMERGEGELIPEIHAELTEIMNRARGAKSRD